MTAQQRPAQNNSVSAGFISKRFAAIHWPLHCNVVDAVSKTCKSGCLVMALTTNSRQRINDGLQCMLVNHFRKVCRAENK